MFKLASIAIIGSAAAADWAMLNNAADSMCMDVGIMADGKSHIVAAGSSSAGSQALFSDGSANYTLIDAPQTMMGMNIGVNHVSGKAVIGGMWSGLSGDSEGMEKMSAGQGLTQSVEAFGDSSFAQVGTFGMKNGVVVSNDDGETWDFSGIDAQYAVRYGAFPSATTWYVTAGMWPMDDDVTGFPVNQRVSHDGVSPSVNLKVADDEGYTCAVLKTTDAGASWNVVFEDNSTFYPNGIHCADEEHCVFVAEGSQGAYVYTIADGETAVLSKTVTEPNASMMGARMTSATEHFTCGSYGPGQFSQSGSFLHSTDGGESYTETTVDGFMCMGMDMLDNAHGYAAGITAMNTGAVVQYA